MRRLDGISNSQSLLKLMSIELLMPSNHFILCQPLLLLPSIFPRIRVFSNESILRIRWPEYWRLSFSIVLSMNSQDWFPLGWTGWIKSLLQHHSSKASILRCSAFFIVQLSHPYMTTGKTIALTRRTFVGKVMSLLFNMLSRLDFPGGSDGKASAYNAGDLGSIPGSGRSPGEGNGNPLQYSCLENPMDRRAW